MLLPGFILALGFFPLTLMLLDAVGWSKRAEVSLVISAGVLGWLMSILDLQIYMLFEGRRYWPKRIRSFFVRSEWKRLAGIIDVIENNSPTSREAREASVEVRKFPLHSGSPTVEHPTRLGNLIISYERYPKTRYGVDAPFFWYRMWLSLNKDMKEEIDNQQAIADSAVYGSFACGFSGILWVIYCVLDLLPFIQSQHLVGLSISLVIAGLFIFLSFLLYRVSLAGHVHYGELFKALFDNYEKQIDVTRVVDLVSRTLHDSSIKNLDRRSQMEIMWRYLHNYRIKCPRTDCVELKPMSPEDLMRHNVNVHGIAEPNIDALERVPARAFYVTVSKATNYDRKRRYLKAIDTVLTATLLILGLFYGIAALFIVAAVVAVLLWLFESRIMNRQKPFISALRQEQNIADRDLAQLYGGESYQRWLPLYVMFPHVIYVVIAFGLFIWRAIISG
jgi:hypothetical protein